MGHDNIRTLDLEAAPAVPTEIAEIAADVQLAYGELAKAFICAMVVRCMKRRQPMMEDFWSAVGEIVFTEDPEPTAGCPGELANDIRLH